MCKENLKLTFFYPQTFQECVCFYLTFLWTWLSAVWSDINLSFLGSGLHCKICVFLKICMKFEKKNLTGCVKSYNQVCVDLFEYNMSCSQHWDCFDSFSLYSLTMLSITCVLIVMGDIRCTEPNTLYFD